MPNEAWVKDGIKKILKPYQWLHVWMPPAGMHGTGGQHDFLICQIGLFWSIEAKAGTNTPTAGQIKFAKKIQEAGGLCLCINEHNLRLVKLVVDGINALHYCPLELNHDFDAWTPKKYL